ncbi:MAG: hypothetical protein GPOALKHO_000584 [Sodalis sp.]|nr:MAG: hypothetical protein GPOALKHO_000584 [Sodalis sp.]
MGSAFGHIALGVDNTAAACERIHQTNGKVTHEAGAGEREAAVIVFLEDPDSYNELVENTPVKASTIRRRQLGNVRVVGICGFTAGIPRHVA